MPDWERDSSSGFCVTSGLCVLPFISPFMKFLSVLLQSGRITVSICLFVSVCIDLQSENIPWEPSITHLFWHTDYLWCMRYTGNYQLSLQVNNINASTFVPDNFWLFLSYTQCAWSVLNTGFSETHIQAFNGQTSWPSYSTTLPLTLLPKWLTF